MVAVQLFSIVAMEKCPMLTPVQQVEYCCRHRGTYNSTGMSLMTAVAANIHHSFHAGAANASTNAVWHQRDSLGIQQNKNLDSIIKYDCTLGSNRMIVVICQCRGFSH